MQEINEKQVLQSTLTDLQRGQEKLVTSLERVFSTIQLLSGSLKNLAKIVDDNISAQKEISSNITTSSKT